MNTFDEIFKKINDYSTIIIHRHQHPDPDALGSQAGLARSLKLAFPEKKILCAGGPEGDLVWINKMDEVKDEDYQGALVITVDTANTPRISDDRFRMGDFLIKMDHHPDVDPYGDLRYVEPENPAAAEIIFDFIKAEKLPLTKEVAYPIYAGMVGDTGRFMYAETTPATLKAAYELAATGIDITEIAMNISTVTLEQAKLQNSVIDLLHVDPCGAAYAVVTQQQLHKLGINEDQASATIGTPGRIKGIIAWNIFVEKADGTYRVHYRSKGPIINQLAEQHNGGGHALASGANAVDMKEVEQIFAEVVEVTKKYNENANE